MKISEVFADPRRKVFSFELFPPKTDAGQVALERTIRDLAELQPAYVSVTYGAGGSTRAKTLGLVEWIQ
ncbi:MAG TPA: methylenetetrahydrofolate reductase, partial [Polyangia bacterium]|nr:methylenetetrahydrofolate reductase [Polyangia bacterium]